MPSRYPQRIVIIVSFDEVHDGSKEFITPCTDPAVLQQNHERQRFDGRRGVPRRSTLPEDRVKSVKGPIDDFCDLVTALSVSVGPKGIEEYVPSVLD